MAYLYIISAIAVGASAYVASYYYVPTLDQLSRAGLALGFAGLTATVMYFVNR